MTPPPPRSTRFPYTTLFRSHHHGERALLRARDAAAHRRIDERHALGVEKLCDPGRHPGTGGGEIDKAAHRSEEHTSELQSRRDLVCRLLLEKKKKHTTTAQR